MGGFERSAAAVTATPHAQDRPKVQISPHPYLLHCLLPLGPHPSSHLTPQSSRILCPVCQQCCASLSSRLPLHPHRSPIPTCPSGPVAQPPRQTISKNALQGSSSFLPSKRDSSSFEWAALILKATACRTISSPRVPCAPVESGGVPQVRSRLSGHQSSPPSDVVLLEVRQR